MESVSSEIVNPERMSVSELREWLARFGDKNREHYQKNTPQTRPESYHIRQRIDGVRQKIERFEETLDLSASGNSSQESDENLRFPPRKKVESSTHPDNGPFFREFDREPPPTFHPAARGRFNGKRLTSSSTDIGDCFRIVSIQKLLDPPKPHRRGRSFSSWEDVSPHPTAGATWHPNAARRTSLLDDTVTATSDDDEDTLDTASIGTGRFTDPGTSPRLHCLSRRLVRRLKKGENDDGDDDGDEVGEKSGSKLRRKLPLLLCKSSKDKQVERSFLYKTLAVQDVAFEEPEETPTAPTEVVLQPMRPYHGKEMHNASILEGHMLTSDTLDLLCSGRVDPNKYQRPNAFVEDATESSWSEDSGLPSIAPNAIDAKLGDIFAEEDHKDMDKTTYTRMDFEQEIPTTCMDHRDEPPISPHRESQQKVKSSSKWNPPELKKRDSQDSSSSSHVNEAVRKFGGSSKKSAIQRRKEELERQWAAQKEPSHVKKIKWRVCSTTGTYKKKVILDFADE